MNDKLLKIRLFLLNDYLKKFSKEFRDIKIEFNNFYKLNLNLTTPETENRLKSYEKDILELLSEFLNIFSSLKNGVYVEKNNENEVNNGNS